MEGKIEGDQVILTKIIGDDCVTSGYETFRTKLENDGYDTGKKYTNKFVVGNPANPNSDHVSDHIIIKDINLFVSWGMNYYRNPKITSFAPPAPVAPALPVLPAPAPLLIAPAPAPLPIAPAPAPLVIAPAPAPAPLVIAPAPVAPAAGPYVYYYTNYFLGNWNGLGYTCDALTPQIETVNIRYDNGNFHAYKILGDNCVKTGQLSFNGALPTTLWQGANIPVNFVVGSPEHPSSSQVPNTVHIVDLNTFQIGTHTYYRVMGGEHTAPANGAYINMSPLVGHSAYPGPGYVKLNPKTNLRAPVRRFVVVEEETNKPATC